MPTHAIDNIRLLSKRYLTGKICPARISSQLNTGCITRIGFVLLINAAFTHHALAADYYRWTDQEGILHLSETPPHTSTYGSTIVHLEKLTTKTYTPPSDDSDSTQTDEDTLNEFDASLKPELSLKDPKRCRAEKGRLSLLNSGARIRMKDKNGEDIYLSAQQIQNEITQSQKAISESC